MNYMIFTKKEDGMRLYIQREDIILFEEIMEGGTIIHLVYGCYLIKESVDQIFKKYPESHNIKFSNN